MTEQEAFEKACCGPDGCGKPIYGRGDSYNRFVSSLPDNANVSDAQLDALRHADTQPRLIRKTCVGSACMAWRQAWAPGQATDAPGQIPAIGYCGLAGAPR